MNASNLFFPEALNIQIQGNSMSMLTVLGNPYFTGIRTVQEIGFARELHRHVQQRGRVGLVGAGWRRNWRDKTGDVRILVNQNDGLACGCHGILGQHVAGQGFVSASSNSKQNLAFVNGPRHLSR